MTDDAHKSSPEGSPDAGSQRAGGRKTTIRLSIARNLMLMILLTAGSILIVSYRFSHRMVSELSEALISQQLDLTELELQRFFGPIETTLVLFRDWSRSGMIEVADFEAIRRSAEVGDPAPDESVHGLNERFIPLLERLPQISSMLLADQNGDEYLLMRSQDAWVNRVSSVEDWGSDKFWMRREADGRYAETSWRDLDYDPRTRPWFTGAMATPEDGGPHWTLPYRFHSTGEPGITASVQWRDATEPDVVNVIAFDILLLDVSRFTSSLEVSPNGKALILNEDGVVLGLPRGERFDTPQELREHVLTPIRELETPEIHDAVGAWEASGSAPGSIISYQSGGENWWVGARAVRLGNRHFRIAVIAPESDFLGDVVAQRNLAVAITLMALLLALLLAMIMARRFSWPLAALAAQAERMQQLDVSKSPRIGSKLREVEQLAESQESMRIALDSFSRYVPLEVVRELMRRDEAANIGGARREITVLFTDIQGFTSVAERFEPEALTHHMSDYFREMLGTVQNDGFGEVTQLTGDGFVAFWGAPIENDDHATHAAHSVLECRRRLAALNLDWRDRGLPELPTRFGLATGPVVVGNVGSPERLVYTAVGDTINLASRLEGLNRFYGTWVLASETTRRATGDQFVWRRVDRVRAKGKSEAIEIHELLGRAGEVPDATLEFAARYEQALELYRARDLRAARDSLETLARAHPDDRSVERLLGIVLELGEEPLPDAWDGTSDFFEK